MQSRYTFQQCCKSSGQYKDLEKVTKIAREHEEDKFSDYMMECVRIIQTFTDKKAQKLFILIAFQRFFQKINQDVFKEFKLTNGNDDVDMDAVINYLDSAFTDKISAESYKVSAQECYEEISSNFVKIQSKYEAAPFELNRTDCNVKFMAMATCMEIKKFLVISLKTCFNCF